MLYGKSQFTCILHRFCIESASYLSRNHKRQGYLKWLENARTPDYVSTGNTTLPTSIDQTVNAQWSVLPPPGDRTEGEIHTAFYKWLDLFLQQPQKVLSFTSPYEAINQIVNPSQLMTVGELLDRYFAYAKKTMRSTRINGEHPYLQCVRRVQKFLQPYHSWPTSDFGPDELLQVQNALVQYEYVHGNRRKRYTRGGVNDMVKWIRKIWKWGMGRQ